MKNYVGIDVGSTKMHMCAIVDGQYIDRRVLTGLDCTKEKLKTEIDQFISELPFIPDGVGLALPGLVEGDHTVALSDMSAITGVTAEYFSGGRFPVRLINDVKAATVAEIANYPDADTIAVIMAGSGHAIGVYSKGKMLTGAKGFSGELGYCMIPTESGPQTLDDVSGGLGILALAGCDADTLVAKINAHDADALALIKKAGGYFGLALTNILHLFNPDVLVIGGSTSTYKGYMDQALQTAHTYTLEDIYNCCHITTPKDLKRIVALGAMEYIKTGMTF